jgi:hypothetical protein
MGSIPSQPHLSLALLDRRRGPKSWVNPLGIDQANLLNGKEGPEWPSENIAKKGGMKVVRGS